MKGRSVAVEDKLSSGYIPLPSCPLVVLGLEVALRVVDVLCALSGLVGFVLLGIEGLRTTRRGAIEQRTQIW